MKQYVMSLVMLAVVMLIGGCEGKEPELPETAVASIVTYESTTEAVSVFTYTDGQGQLITLTAAWEGHEDLKPGARVLIYYRAEEYGVSSTVVLLSVVPLPGGAPKTADDANSVPASEPLKECTAWISGNYLNISSVVTFAGDAAEVGLYVDMSTVGQQMPGAYVVVRAREGNALAAPERQLYASWNIASILSDPDNRGLDIYFTDSSNTRKVINITR